MTLLDASLLAAAALAAGILNAIAGGGSFLTFPALVWTGVPPITANATSAVAVSPGYLGSVLGYRAELAQLPARTRLVQTAIAATGGVLGALLLLLTPASTFRALVPWLLLFATAAFALGPRLLRWLTTHRVGQPGRAAQAWGLLAVCIYGGYFNGGLGILLMALYALTGESRIQTANALKNLNSFVLSLLSVLTFALAGAVAWAPALLMMVAATAGGYIGARAARRLPSTAVRATVIGTGLVMSALFFWRS
jgi:uncharacterized membrane protein YfcA